MGHDFPGENQARRDRLAGRIERTSPDLVADGKEDVPEGPVSGTDWTSIQPIAKPPPASGAMAELCCANSVLSLTRNSEVSTWTMVDRSGLKASANVEESPRTASLATRPDGDKRWQATPLYNYTFARFDFWPPPWIISGTAGRLAGTFQKIDARFDERRSSGLEF